MLEGIFPRQIIDQSFEGTIFIFQVFVNVIALDAANLFSIQCNGKLGRRQGDNVSNKRD